MLPSIFRKYKITSNSQLIQYYQQKQNNEDFEMEQRSVIYFTFFISLNKAPLKLFVASS